MAHSLNSLENGLKVGIKIRPLSQNDLKLNIKSNFQIIPELNSLLYLENHCQNKQIFQCDYLFDENDLIEEIYHLIGHSIVLKTLEGKEGAIFACKFRDLFV